MFCIFSWIYKFHILFYILKEKGITVLDEVTEYGEIGKFVHILDPEGNKIELWEPPKSNVEDKK